METSDQHHLIAWYRNYRRKIFFSLLSCVAILLVMMLLHQSLKPIVLEEAVLDAAVTVSNEYVSSSISSNTSEQAKVMFSYGQIMGQIHGQRRLAADHVLARGEASKLASINSTEQSDIYISVFLKEQNKIEKVSLEKYVLGVALAEIPLEFEYEAIKAQMLVARTYILHRLWKNTMRDEAVAYDVTDQTTDQVYLPLGEVERYRQVESRQIHMEKFERALAATKDMLITYNDEPIEAVFFSASNGYTENAEDYWGDAIPYLRSVSSEWDKEYSPSYQQKQMFTYQYIKERFSSSDIKPTLKIEEKTKANRIATIAINGEIYSGREVRELLGLASNDFTWVLNDKKQEITFLTYGYGHGVGLSQWGANGMAAEGYLANAIIEHYYSGVEIQQASKLVNN